MIESAALATPVPFVVAHVERLELLERVAAAADAHAAAHDRVQVDEHVVAQQIVDGSSPTPWRAAIASRWVRS